MKRVQKYICITLMLSMLLSLFTMTTLSATEEYWDLDAIPDFTGFGLLEYCCNTDRTYLICGQSGFDTDAGRSLAQEIEALLQASPIDSMGEKADFNENDTLIYLSLLKDNSWKNVIEVYVLEAGICIKQTSQNEEHCMFFYSDGNKVFSALQDMISETKENVETMQRLEQQEKEAERAKYETKLSLFKKRYIVEIPDLDIVKTGAKSTLDFELGVCEYQIEGENQTKIAYYFEVEGNGTYYLADFVERENVITYYDLQIYQRDSQYYLYDKNKTVGKLRAKWNINSNGELTEIEITILNSGFTAVARQGDFSESGSLQGFFEPNVSESSDKNIPDPGTLKTTVTAFEKLYTLVFPEKNILDTSQKREDVVCFEAGICSYQTAGDTEPRYAYYLEVNETGRYFISDSISNNGMITFYNVQIVPDGDGYVLCQENGSSKYALVTLVYNEKSTLSRAMVSIINTNWTISRVTKESGGRTTYGSLVLPQYFIPVEVVEVPAIGINQGSSIPEEYQGLTKEESIEKYRAYYKDGVKYSASYYAGERNESLYQPELLEKIDFTIAENFEGISSDGKTTFTLYDVKQKIYNKNGELVNDRYIHTFLKVTGNLGEKLYKERAFAWRIREGITISTFPDLDPQSARCVWQEVVEVTDQYFVLVGNTDDGNIDIHYADSARTGIQSVKFKFDELSVTVPFAELDYIGGFIQYFLPHIYGEDWVREAMGMGLTPKESEAE